MGLANLGIPVVLGIDPGFASLGYAIVRLHPGGEEVVDLGVLNTEASSKKRKVLAADDNARRGRELACDLWKLMRDSRTMKGVLGRTSVRAVCAEAMSFPRNASNAAKIGMSWGLIFAQLEELNLPLLQASPQEVKMAACRKKDASKIEVQEAMLKAYGRRWGSHVAERYPKAEAEHAFDALAVVHTCLKADTIRIIRNLVA